METSLMDLTLKELDEQVIKLGSFFSFNIKGQNLSFNLEWDEAIRLTNYLAEKNGSERRVSWDTTLSDFLTVYGSFLAKTPKKE